MSLTVKLSVKRYEIENRRSETLIEIDLYVRAPQRTDECKNATELMKKEPVNEEEACRYLSEINECYI